MAKNEKAAPEASFRHYTSIGSNGEILYACPMEIKTQADLDNYRISWRDCRTLNFHGSEKVTVYFLMVDSREFADYQWSYLDSQHRRGYRNSRCWIPGKQKGWVRCPDTNSCACCPFKEQRKPPFISWDQLLASGYEPEATASAEEQAIAKAVWNEIRTLMDAEDVRIAKAFMMRYNGYKGEEIAAELGISNSRVSNLITRAHEIAKAYKEKQDS